jgi:hypothetical protein
MSLSMSSSRSLVTASVSVILLSTLSSTSFAQGSGMGLLGVSSDRSVVTVSRKADPGLPPAPTLIATAPGTTSGTAGAPAPAPVAPPAAGEGTRPANRPRINLETPGGQQPPPAAAGNPGGPGTGSGDGGPGAQPEKKKSFIQRVIGFIAGMAKYLPEIIADVSKWAGRIFGGAA